MDSKVLRMAYDRIDGEKQVLILQSGFHIIFEEMDFAGTPVDSVWLYNNRLACCCIDIRSIEGISQYPMNICYED